MSHARHRLLRTAVPLLVTCSMQFALTVIGTAFIGRLGPVSLAGMSIAAALYALPCQVLAGFAVGYQILAAHDLGRGDRAALSTRFRQILFVLGLAACALCALFQFPWLFTGLMTGDVAVRAEADAYLAIRSLCFPLIALVEPLRMSLDATGRTRHSMVTGVAAIATNLALDALLILGLGLGVCGAAWAAVIATTVQFIGLLVMFARHRPFSLRAGRNRLSGAGRMLSISAFSVVDGLLDYAGIAVFFAIAGHLGTDALAASRIVYVCLLVTFTTLFSIGVALQIRLGAAISQNDAADVIALRRAGARFLFVVGLCFAAPLLLAPSLIVELLTGGAAFTADLHVPLAIVALAILPLALSVRDVASLRAHSRTDLTLYVNLFCIYAVLLPLAALLAPRLGVTGLFSGFLGYFAARAVLCRCVLAALLRRRNAAMASDRRPAAVGTRNFQGAMSAQTK